MSIKKREVDIVKDLIITWSKSIELDNSNCYYDINKDSEGLVANLLNLVYKLNLTNLNEEKANFAGIDLGDKYNKIAFQVTSRKDAEKIRENLNTFVKNKYNEIYTNGIRFLILTTENNNFSFGKNSPQKIYSNFNKDNHILTFRDLKKEIDSIYDTDFERFNRIRNLLQREIQSTSIFKQEPNEELPVFSFSFQHRNFLLNEEDEIAISLQDISRNYEQNKSLEFDILIKEEELILLEKEELLKDTSNIQTKKRISDLKDAILSLVKIKEEIKFKISSIVLLKFHEGYQNDSFQEFAKISFSLLSNLWELQKLIDCKPLIEGIFKLNPHLHPINHYYNKKEEIKISRLIKINASFFKRN